MPDMKSITARCTAAERPRWKRKPKERRERRVMKKPKPGTNMIDRLAEACLKEKAVADRVAADYAEVREGIAEAVEMWGSLAPRSGKTKMLAGRKFELRVSARSEITVDPAKALVIEDLCRFGGERWLFPKLFRSVPHFILADGAYGVINARLPAGAPRNLRALFARAVQVRALAPQLEVRKRDEPGKKK
jgi:hypothetical protein